MLESRVGTDGPPTQREKVDIETEIKKLKMKPAKDAPKEDRKDTKNPTNSKVMVHHTATFSKT